MSEQTQNIVAAVTARLRGATRRVLRASLFSGLVLFLSIAIVLWITGALVEAAVWLPPSGRTTILGVGSALLLAAGLILVVRPLLQMTGVLARPSEDHFARMVEKAVPVTKDRLVDFLHLSSGRHSASPPEFVESALHSLHEPFAETSFSPIEDFSRFRRSLRLALLPLVALVVLLTAAPSAFLGASARLVRPYHDFVRPAPYRLQVSPGNFELVRGDSIEFQVAVIGATDAVPALEIRGQNRPLTAFDTRGQGAERTFRFVRASVRDDFEYRANAGTVASPWYVVTVVDRPVVRQLNVTVATPRYSRIGRIELSPDVGDVTALPGSTVNVDVQLGGGATSHAEIVFDDGTSTQMELTGVSATGSFQLKRNGTYRVRLTGPGDVGNADPIEYRLQTITDERPSISISRPEAVAQLDETFAVDLSVRLVDDFGFSKLAIFHRLAESRFGTTVGDYREIPIGIDAPFDLDQVVEHVWDAVTDNGSPVPGDVIEYFVRVWDNDAWSGYKRADSRVQRLVMPSLAEQYEELRSESDDSSVQMEDLLQKATDVRERFDELRDELRRKTEADWDDERQLEQIQSLQQELETGVDEVTRQLDDVIQRMDENRLVSDETLDMFEELQKVVEEINSPELMEALRQMQEAMKTLDPQQMQEAIRDFEFSEEQFRERLKRALDLFKKLQVQQSLEEVARRAEELARLQEQLRDETKQLAEKAKATPKSEDSQDNPDDQEQAENRAEELAREQDRASSEMQDLEDRLEDVQEMMEQLPRNPSEELEELRSRLRDKDVPTQLQDNAQQLRDRKMQPAMEGQEQIQQQLSQLQQQLEQMESNMRGRQLQINMAGIRKALNDVLTLSQQQESVRSEVAETASDSPALRNFAKRQIELGEELSVVSDTLQKLSREIPEMTRQVQAETGRALREIEQATESLAGRSARRAAGHQKASMMHLNELALLLSDLLSMLMNQQQMGMGMPSMQQMIEQMQQMAGQQQMLNEQIQQMLNDMQGQRLTSDAQARMRQLAEQQERLRQQLKELSRNPELRGKALGDLEHIAEQMEETVRELLQSRTDRPLLERQRQILTRLLDASRSLNERGKERRRESRTGSEGERPGPSELSPSERANELRRDLIRALEAGYAPDYEELIKKYFDLLQGQERLQQQFNP